LPLPGIIAEIVCNLLFYGAIAAASDDIGKKTKINTSSISIDSIREKQRQGKSLSPAERRVLLTAPCSVEGCNALVFRTTEHCLRHQPHMVSEPETEEEAPIDPEAVVEENWWEDEKD